MNNISTARVHGTHTHSELTAKISDFPILVREKTLYKASLSPNDQARMDLMLQSLNKDAFRKEFCFKNCLRLNDTRYMAFCFQKKCNASAQEAFKTLNLLK